MASTSSDSSSDSSSERRHRKKKRAVHKERKREKKERKRMKKEKKDSKSKEKKTHHARSVITGKRIRREEGAAADAEGEARRAALLAHWNEGEDDEVMGVQAQRAGATAASSTQEQMVRSAYNDPQLMLSLMQQSHAAQLAKRQRLGAMVRGEGQGASEDPYSATRLVGRGHADTVGAGPPRDYKRERAEQERVAAANP